MRRRAGVVFARGLVLLLTLGVAGAVSAAGPTALAEAELPADARLGSLKDLDGYFPFIVPESAEAWRARSDALRRQVLVSQGLCPMPTRHPLNAMVHGRIEQKDYTIEKVFFESMPGFFVTGNLYRPKGKTGPRPGVLCPHGHWANGRFYDCGKEAVRRQITQGAERFEDGGRSPMQSRCVQLARMGCVVFHYDMIGYADSRQISREIIHGFREQRPEMNDPENWGLFSPQAESRLQSPMGLQTYNSIRSLDFLTGLPDVDTDRIAVTGASGGGTQTFMLAAVDSRVKVAFPAVMVSTAMQGGCTCENACCLRVGTGNVELAGLFAPKPLGLTAADDWTVEMPTKGFPELKQLYQLLGAPEHVKLTALRHFDHNYNYVSRAAMYHWFNKHLQLGLDQPIVEERYERLSPRQLTVWDEDHPRPAGGADFERELVSWWTRDSRRQLDELLPTAAASCRQYQEMIRRGLDGMIPRGVPCHEHLDLKIVSEKRRDGYRERVGLLTYHLPPRLAAGATRQGKREGVQEQLPLVWLQPGGESRRVCLMAFPQGKAGLFQETGELKASLRQLLDAGIAICAADLLYQGEFLEDRRRLEKTRRVDNPREAAAYTFGYNPSVFAHRVSDLLTLIGLLGQETDQMKDIDLVGLGSAGPVAACARAKAGDRVARLAVDQADFRFARVDDPWSPMFLPGGAKYHDLPGMLALAAPAPLWLATGEEELAKPIAAAYRAHEKLESVDRFAGQHKEKLQALVNWLLAQSDQSELSQ